MRIPHKIACDPTKLMYTFFTRHVAFHLDVAHCNHSKTVI